MTKPPKIAKARGRSVDEWSSTNPDAKIPERVKLRVLRRNENKCFLTGILIADGQQFDCDHRVPLEEGGAHAESNLVPVLRLPHEVKTAAERKRQAKADRIAKASHGMKPAPARPIQSRGFAPSEKAPRIQKQALPPRRMFTEI
jgi:5-methylcytosine-specific restriction protein A